MALKLPLHLLNKPWLAKTAACFFSVLYLAASLELGSVLQVFQHRHEAEASQGWACARHNCACKSAKQCNLHCCCKLKSLAPPSPEPREDGATWAQCSGPSGEDALLNLRLAPHASAPPLVYASPPIRRSPCPIRKDEPLVRPPDPLLKVPISSIS